MQKVSVFEISEGPKFAKEFVKEETDLTADMLATYGRFIGFPSCSRSADVRSVSWKTVKLKPYNFKAKGALAESGALHPRMAILPLQVLTWLASLILSLSQ